jgi:hypothetical protein
VLDGARGRPKLDVDAVADILCRLGWLAAELGPALADIEVNPLMVRAAEQGATAADARGTLTTSLPGHRNDQNSKAIAVDVRFDGAL